MNRRPLALTTGQAAKCCFVTPDTIANWIKAGLLRAQRTAGGRYRILLNDLRIFMQSKGMSTEFLDAEPKDRPMCWQFQSRSSDGIDNNPTCKDCIVKFLGVLNCFKLMGMHPGKNHRAGDCEQCEYYKRWGKSSHQL